MCGIAGIVARESGVLMKAESMGAALAHRGPDSSGLFFARTREGMHLAMSHRRLALFDLSPAGHQPMLSRDGRWTIVFNGEIFNYLELRRELENRGAQFSSATDTEVLLAACTNWGVEQTLERATGMFAFALWDGFNEELTL